MEEVKGVSIARQAVQGTTDEVIDVLSVHPGVKELVEKQSSGFATEIVEEIRERTVSLDTLIERVTRKVLRKKPRTQFLPAPEVVSTPSPEVGHGSPNRTSVKFFQRMNTKPKPTAFPISQLGY
jgi:hypothetical protein